MGIGIGIFFAGIINSTQTFIPVNLPLWPNYDALNGYISWIGSLLSTLTHYLYATVMFSFLYIIIDTATNHWRKNRLLCGILSALCGISALTLSTIDTLALWIIFGTIIGLIALALYRYIIRNNYSLIPLATGSFTITGIVQQGMFNAYPGALFETGINISVTIIIASLWYCYMNKNNQ